MRVFVVPSDFESQCANQNVENSRVAGKEDDFEGKVGGLGGRKPTDS